MKEDILKMIEHTLVGVVDSYFGIDVSTENEKEFVMYVRNLLGIEYELDASKSPEEIKEELVEEALKIYEAKEQEVGAEQLREIERIIILRTVDTKWIDHLDAMEQLKQGVRLRGYAQKDPVVEFRMESYDVFNEMTAGIAETVVRSIMHIQKRNENMERVNVIRQMITNMNAAANAATEKAKPKVKSAKDRVGRNDPCPCGSGKKYKQCCGK